MPPIPTVGAEVARLSEDLAQECPICLDLLDRPSITACLHVFWWVQGGRVLGEGASILLGFIARSLRDSLRPHRLLLLERTVDCGLLLQKLWCCFLSLFQPVLSASSP
jgi:hypothetical protein